MKMLFVAAMLAAAHAHNHVSGPEAVATFTAANSGGATGWARVAGGQLNISLDLTNFNFSLTRVNFSQCRAGITYHIHDTITGNMVGDACGAAGGHYDPWFACGGATGATACANKGGCIMRGAGANPPAYACSTASFTAMPLTACEVGDWSGKYGKMMPATGTDMYSISSTTAMPNPSVYEISSTQLYAAGKAKSIVFHCGSPRILCAPFMMDVTKNSSTEAHVQGLVAATAAGTRQVADFGALNGPLVEFGGGEVNVTGSFAMVSACGNTGMMTISNAAWTSTTATSASGTACDAYTAILDPTIQCPMNSGSMYCTNGMRCTNMTVTPASMGLYYVAQGSMLTFPSAAFSMQTRYMDQSAGAIGGKAVVVSCGTSKWCAKIVPGPVGYTTMAPAPGGAAGVVLSRLVVASLLVGWFVW